MEKADKNSLIKGSDRIKKQLDRLPKKAPFWGIYWGEPHSENVHFTTENKVTLFDFDQQCGWGWRAFDLTNE